VAALFPMPLSSTGCVLTHNNNVSEECQPYLHRGAPAAVAQPVLARPRVPRQRHRARQGVAVQVNPFESKGLKPVTHFIVSRVETRRFQAMGQLDSTCTAPPGGRARSAAGAPRGASCCPGLRGHPYRTRMMPRLTSGRAPRAERTSRAPPGRP
jgi:hypothetical protein